MARTNLPTYTSVYKDPGSVAINTELRRRYANAFANDDKLTGAVDGMVNANFEGDQMLKDDLSSRYNKQLQERARRGDYETMGQNIARDSRQFVKEYAPIEQNYKAVQAYQLRIQEAYKEGKIDEETYRRAFAMSAHNYKGLQQNEDGSINDQSFFSGYNFVDDQNISALMDDAMQGYAAHKGGSDIQRVGQGPNAMYKMRVGSEYEVVPQADVERIFNDVISDPSVRAYLNQKADLRTFDVSDEEMQKQLSLNLYGNPEDPNDKGLYGVMNDLISKGKDKEAEAYKNIIEQQESLLHGTGVESPEEMINMRKQAAHQQVVDSEIGRERNAALTKYVRNNRWSTSIQEYDDIYKMGYQKKIDEYIADYTEDTPLVEIEGKDHKQITASIELEKSMQEDQVTKFNDLLKEHEYAGEPLTQEQILAGDFHNLTIGKQPITDFIDIKMLNLIQDKLRIHQNKQNRSENILTAFKNDYKGEEGDEIFRNKKLQIGVGAGNQSTTYGKIIDMMNYITSDDYEKGSTVSNDIKEMFSSKHGNNYIDLGDGKIRIQYGFDENGKLLKNMNWKTEGMVIDLNNIDSLGYLNIMKQASKQRNSQWSGWTASGSKISGDLMYHLFKEHDKKHGTRIFDGVIVNAAPDASNLFTVPGRGHMTDYKESFEQFNKDRDEYLIKASTTYAGGQASAVIPGSNNDEAQKNTKIVNNALNNRVLPDHFQIYYDNKKQEGTGTIESFKEQYNIISDLTVQDIKFVTTPFMGEAVLQLQVKGKNKVGGSTSANQTRTVFLPLNQIKNSGLQEYINSPAFKIEMDVNAARQSPVENTTIQFKKGSDDIGTTLTWDFNKDGSKNSETVLIQTADGGVQEFAVGDLAISFMINEAVTNGYSYWVVKD